METYDFYVRDDEGVHLVEQIKMTDGVAPVIQTDWIKRMLDISTNIDGTPFDITVAEDWSNLPDVYLGSRFWVAKHDAQFISE